jgi:hypothetical protein
MCFLELILRSNATNKKVKFEETNYVKQVAEIVGREVCSWNAALTSRASPTLGEIQGKDQEAWILDVRRFLRLA